MSLDVEAIAAERAATEKRAALMEACARRWANLFARCAIAYGFPGPVDAPLDHEQLKGALAAFRAELPGLLGRLRQAREFAADQDRPVAEYEGLAPLRELLGVRMAEGQRELAQLGQAGAAPPPKRQGEVEVATWLNAALWSYGDYPWDRWSSYARSRGVVDELAALGRAVMRDAYQHGWTGVLSQLCGWIPGGPGEHWRLDFVQCELMTLAAKDSPEKARRLWERRLETDGGRRPHGA